MKKQHLFFILAIGLISLFAMPNICQAQPGGSETTVTSELNKLSLWYTEPATEWTKALPIGNGRLGAMIYGGIHQEQLQLNEETLWNGGPHDYSNPDAYQYLATVRKLLDEGKYSEAEETAGKMMGNPVKQMAYQPLGDLFLMFSRTQKVLDYQRKLDLKNAVNTVSYSASGVNFTRRTFASHPDQAIVIQLDSDSPGQITFDLLLTSPHHSKSEVLEGNKLLMAGQLGPRKERGLIGPWEGEGTKFAAQVKVMAESGEVILHDDKISVRDADAVTLVYVAATSFVNAKDVGGDPVKMANEYMANTEGKSFVQLYQRHVDDYKQLFDRVSIDLGGKQDKNNLPTDQRLQQVMEGGTDPLLSEQLFQYGRYMMIAGSRPGTQALTLQGIWNGTINPPWCSKYTININIQMNYWVAEVCNLSECHEPFLRMVSELQEPGKRTAEAHYKADGWVTHHNTDLWRGTAPVDGSHWGMWPTGGAWLCQHLWEHYQYTGDMEHLKKSYPIMKGAAEFFLDVLVKNEDGYLVTSPSISPEHSHGGENPDGLSSNRRGASLCAGPTMDLQLLNDLFSNCIAASEILDIDKTFRSKVAKTKERLAPMKIGKHGQLQEWQEDWDNPDNPHGHVSHLYGLYPSSQINPRETPKLFEAAKTSLVQRGTSGGWPGAWRISLWARAGDGDQAHNMLNNHVMHGLTENLFNGRRVFQSDANFGATAGMAEMLLQSHLGEIHLLPALPQTWPDGSVKGLRARDGFEVDIQWNEGELTECKIKSLLGEPFIVRYGDKTVKYSLSAGETVKIRGNEL